MMLDLPPWIGIPIVLVGAPIIDRLCRPPRRVKHYPIWDGCGLCGAPWTDGHRCGPVTIPHFPIWDGCGLCGAPWTDGHRCAPVPPVAGPLQGWLRRVRPGTDLARHQPGDMAQVRHRWPPPAD